MKKIVLVMIFFGLVGCPDSPDRTESGNNKPISSEDYGDGEGHETDDQEVESGRVDD